MSRPFSPVGQRKPQCLPCSSLLSRERLLPPPPAATAGLVCGLGPRLGLVNTAETPAHQPGRESADMRRGVASDKAAAMRACDESRLRRSVVSLGRRNGAPAAPGAEKSGISLRELITYLLPDKVRAAKN